MTSLPGQQSDSRLAAEQLAALASRGLRFTPRQRFLEVEGNAITVRLRTSDIGKPAGRCDLHLELVPAGLPPDTTDKAVHDLRRACESLTAGSADGAPGGPPARPEVDGSGLPPDIARAIAVARQEMAESHRRSLQDAADRALARLDRPRIAEEALRAHMFVLVDTDKSKYFRGAVTDDQGRAKFASLCQDATFEVKYGGLVTIQGLGGDEVADPNVSEGTRRWPFVFPRPKRAAAAAAAALFLIAVGLLGIAAWMLSGPDEPAHVAGLDTSLNVVLGSDEGLLSAGNTAIDTASVRSLQVHVRGPDGDGAVERTIPLYEAAGAAPGPTGTHLTPLAQLDCPGARPFAAIPAGATWNRYQATLEAVPFNQGADATTLRTRWHVQRNFGAYQTRRSPWPIWIEAPRRGELLQSPFLVTGQAYQDGFMQVWSRPKAHEKFYLKGARAVSAGRAFPALKVTEGAAEGFELYVLFASLEQHLPDGRSLLALPVETGAVDVIGPVDFLLRQRAGPVRSAAELGAELDLVKAVAARFIDPAAEGTEAARVNLKHDCRGTVSDKARELDLRFILGVRPVPGRHHVWLQSEPWHAEDGRFTRPARFGFDDRQAERFELWLIAVGPDVDVALEAEQAWLASALPDGCVRVASVPVLRPAGEDARLLDAATSEPY